MNSVVELSMGVKLDVVVIVMLDEEDEESEHN